MPLDAKGKRMPGDLNGFHHSVGSSCHGADLRRNEVETLVMKTIYICMSSKKIR